MCSWPSALAALSLAVAGVAHAQHDRFPGIGRAATPAEVKAWDIDVRADFQGLPKGAGSVAKGMEVWEAKCASCHGVFGESNQFFTPIVGGTTRDDMRTGRVANLRREDYGRTTMMKLSSVSTLWDYIHRAMPWNQPKSLTVEEVYATTAYILHLAGVVPEDFTLTDTTIREVQQRLPNRNGHSTAHALWPGREFGNAAARPDVNATACMRDCAVEPRVASLLPDFARNAHGNLAEQNRGVGPQRGANTAGAAATAALAAQSPPPGDAPHAVLQKNTCTACHAPAATLVGPSWSDIARRHAGKADYLADKIRAGGSGVWGSVPMPPQAIAAEEARRVAEWLAAGAK